MDSARTVPILDVVRESSRHVTISFHDESITHFEPGQFVMVWVPGVDEVPMALWGGQDGILKILVEAKGDCTKALAQLEPGDFIGIRGPYGRPFRSRGKNVLLVVGGTGTSPLVPLVERAKGRAAFEVVIGGRSKELLLMRDQYERAGGRVHIATDDGSLGFHGRAPDLAKQLMDRMTFDEVLTCGPERMMKAVVELARDRHVPVQASLERWMKCAVGICDACLVDGIRLCRDGPVLEGPILFTLQDFGAFERDPSGTRRPLH